MQPSNKLKSPLMMSAAMASVIAASAQCSGTYDDIARIGGLPRSAPPRSDHYSTESPEVKAMTERLQAKAKQKRKSNRK